MLKYLEVSITPYYICRQLKRKTMKKTKQSKINRAETIISKLVDLQAISNGDMNLQSACRAVRAYIDNLRSSR